MRTIAIINQKGGCGKTTVSINLAAVLAARGQRTLLVDMDPQSHCALGLAVPEAQIEQSLADVLRLGLSGALGLSDVVWQIARHFDLAPAHMTLAGLEQELAGLPDRDRRLAQVLAPVADRYDYCIIDCPPSIGLLTFNALRAAGEVIVPVETGYFAMHGSLKQEATIDLLARRAGHPVRFAVLATMYDVRTKLAREILAELRRRFGERLLPVVVNFNSKLREAASFGQPITEYDPASRGMQDFEELAQWLVDNPPPQTGDPAQALPASPALSRAAELVERAKALSARTTALAARLSRDPDLAGEPALMTTSTQVLQVQERPVQEEEPQEDPMGDSFSEKLRRLYGARQTRQGVLFVQPAAGARAVNVAGDFNGWSDRATPLYRDDRLGVWQTCLPLPPGRYHYRLVVDGQWLTDPYNAAVEIESGRGSVNVVVVAG